jgi:hypothetical protein
MKTSVLASGLALAILSGCSTTVVDTNRAMEVHTPSIRSNHSEAAIEVGEQINGKGCANEFLVIFKSGDSKFLEVHGDGGSDAVARAKAAATYKALAAEKGLSTDFIVHPVWEITRDKTFFGLINDDVCAKVTGYRGVIKSIKPINAYTEFTAPAKSSSSSAKGFLSFLPFID